MRKNLAIWGILTPIFLFSGENVPLWLDSPENIQSRTLYLEERLLYLESVIHMAKDYPPTTWFLLNPMLDEIDRCKNILAVPHNNN